MTLALVLGAGPVLAGPDEGSGGTDSGSTATGGNWLTRWFVPSAKTPQKASPPKDIKKIKDEKDSLAQEPAPTNGATASALRSREEAKYLRRSEACDKLKEIADLTNDAALRKRAEELDARAWDVYNQRTAQLPSSQALFDSDRKTLQKHLGEVPGTPESRSEPAMYTVPGNKAQGPGKEER
jgi:hypothetical protein